MTEMIALAEQRLLRPGGLATSDLDRVFARLMTPAVDAADLYFQHTRSESWLLEDGIVKDGSHSIEQGVGVRAQSGEKTGFAYSDDIVMSALLEAAGSARAIARDGANGNGRPLALTSTRALYPAIDPIDSMSSEAKVRLLGEIDAYARSLDARFLARRRACGERHRHADVDERNRRFCVVASDPARVARYSLRVHACQPQQRE